MDVIDSCVQIKDLYESKDPLEDYLLNSCSSIFLNDDDFNFEQVECTNTLNDVSPNRPIT